MGTKADESALKYQEQNSNDFPLADIRSVLVKLLCIRDELAQVDSVTPEDVQIIANNKGEFLVEHELVTLARNFGEMEPAGLIYTDRLLEHLNALSEKVAQT